MSNIDLTNPKVLQSFMLAQAKEGKGKIFIREKVLCFRNEQGMEFILPDNEKEKFMHLVLEPEKTPEGAEVEEQQKIEAEKDNMSLLELREKFHEVKNYPVPNCKKNDEEWIKSKI